MLQFIFGRRAAGIVAPAALVLAVIVGCGSSDNPAVTASPPTNGDAVQTEVASVLATQEALQEQIDESVAATIAAQTPDVTPGSGATSDGEADDALLSPTATKEIEPIATASPTATLQPEPTSTPVPPAPTSIPEPPKPSPSPTEVPPTPTPDAPAAIIFARPDRGRDAASGENLSFAQASASFDIAQFPARTYIRSGVYFGIAENVTSRGIIESSFVAADTSTVRVTTDVGWNGVLSTYGWGSMASTFQVSLVVVDLNSNLVVAQAPAGKISIESPVASKSVSGNQTLTLDALVGEGTQYAIQLLVTCTSSGSSNVLASDTECAFDRAAGGYVEWRELTVEYLP